MALIQKAFSDIITFSRSSNATRVGPTGVLEYAPHNLLLQSQTFDNASWLKSNSSITANAIAAPDGTVTADKLVEAATTSVHSATQAFTFAADFIYTTSVYAKAGERSFLIIQPTGDSRFAYYNLSNGTVGTVSGSPLSTQIQSVGNNWYRCTITVTSPGATAANCILYSAATDGNATYTGDGTSGIYIWGAQLAVGPYALDYVPTTSAAVYGPRFDYDGSGVTIVEPVSRNLVLYSQEFENAYWTKENASITTNATTAPDGTLTAELLTENSANGVHRAYDALTLATVSHTSSIYAKANGRSWIYVRTDTATGIQAFFNISTGVVGTVGSGITASIQNVGNGWYRCSITLIPIASNNLLVGLASSDNTPSYTGDGTSGAYIWGAQLEVGSTATAYMVSGASNGFRAVPVVSGSATPKGLLVEESRTNLLTYSEDFSNAVWAKGSASVTANYATAPNGTVTAALISGSGGGQRITQTATANGTQQTLSFFVKKPSSGLFSGASLLLYNGTTAAVIGEARFSGETFTVNAITGTATNTAYGNGWYRITLTNPSGLSSGNSLICYLYTDNQGGGSGSNDTVLAWGAQCE